MVCPENRWLTHIFLPIGVDSVASVFWKKLLVRSGIAQIIHRIRQLTNGGENYLHYLSDRLLTIDPRDFREASQYLHLETPDGIDLSWGAPRFELVPSGNTRLPIQLRGYHHPRGLPQLREAVSKSLWERNQLPLRPQEEILITHGASGAFAAAMDAFVNPGDKVVLFDPTSPLFPFALKQRRAKITWVPTWMEKGRSRFRLNQLAKAFRGAKIAVLVNPNNPTGGVFSKEDLEQLAWWAGRHDVLLINDGVLDEYLYEGDLLHPGTLKSTSDRTLTIGSVSKSHALTSARVGWLAGNKTLVSACAMVAATQSPFIPTLCQQIALTAVETGKKKLETVKKDLASRRKYAFDRLQGMGLQPAWPKGGLFFWIPLQPRGLTGRDFAQILLQKHKVLVWPGHFFGPSGNSYFRLSFAQEEGRLREGLTRLDCFVNGKEPGKRHSPFSPPHHPGLQGVKPISAENVSLKEKNEF